MSAPDAQYTRTMSEFARRIARIDGERDARLLEEERGLAVPANAHLGYGLAQRGLSSYQNLRVLDQVRTVCGFRCATTQNRQITLRRRHYRTAQFATRIERIETVAALDECYHAVRALGMGRRIRICRIEN